MNKQEQVQQMTTYMANFVSHIAKVLPDDIIAKLDELGAQEDAPLSKVIYETMKRNQKLAKELNKPVCATGDVHFLDPEQEQFRHILLNASGFSDADKSLPIYFKTTDEMLDEFAYLGAEDCRKVVIDNPNHIAKMCDVIPPLPKGLFAPKLENSAEELERLVY